MRGVEGAGGSEFLFNKEFKTKKKDCFWAERGGFGGGGLE